VKKVKLNLQQLAYKLTEKEKEEENKLFVLEIFRLKTASLDVLKIVS
jgi:hypothetical protein